MSKPKFFFYVLPILFLTHSSWGQAVEFKEQVKLTQYIAEALRELPKNDAKVGRALTKLQRSDQEVARKMIRNWILTRGDFKIAARLNQVVVSKNNHILLTIETAEFSPYVIILNGSQKIEIEPNNILGSIERQLHEKKSSAAWLFEHFKPLMMLPEAHAATGYSAGRLSGLGDAILMYSNVLVGSKSLAKSPWELTGGANDFAVNLDYYLNNNLLAKDRFKFTCGKGQVSGSFLIQNKLHKFTSTSDGLLLDDRYLITTANYVVDPQDIVNLVSNDPLICRSTLVQLQAQRMKPCLDDPYDYCLGMVSFYCGSNNMRIYDLVRDLYGSSRNRSQVLGTTITVQKCENGSCAPSNVTDFMIASLNNSPAVTDLKQKRVAADAKIQAIEEAFAKKHNLPGRLHLIRKGDKYSISTEPQGPSDSRVQRQYKTELELLYRERDTHDAALSKAGASLTADVKKKFSDINLELLEKVALGRAFAVGCTDNDFMAEAEKHGLTFSPESAAQ